MKIHIAAALIKATKSETFEIARSLIKVEDGDFEKMHQVYVARLSMDDLQELANLAKAAKATKQLRVIEAIIDVRNGESDFVVPSFAAFPVMLQAYLTDHFQDGWIYETCDDGQIRPWAITGIRIDAQKESYGVKGAPILYLHAAAYGQNKDIISMISKTWSFSPGDVARRSITKILGNCNLVVENKNLRDSANALDAMFSAVIAGGFARQFRITGAFKAEGYKHRDPLETLGHRVIMDIDPSRMRGYTPEMESTAFDEKELRFVSVPRHADVQVYDLQTHEEFWVSCDNLKLYEYSPALRDSLILPDEQRDLLDILTQNTDMLTSDIIEGKAAGNIILCKGKPGVGKTLTAEIYSEVCEKPLYSVHAGILGTRASDIATSLRTVLQRAQRWDCILLIDEADVFVSERGDNVEQNAIVAEFLRTLESFRGLMFMTTNRPNSIDDAIISRCAAIIHYKLPSADLRRRIWGVMAKNYEVDLGEALIDSLVDTFKKVSARDIKMLLRLVIRVSLGQGVIVDLELFRKCAIFRGAVMAGDEN